MLGPWGSEQLAQALTQKLVGLGLCDAKRMQQVSDAAELASLDAFRSVATSARVEQILRLRDVVDEMAKHITGHRIFSSEAPSLPAVAIDGDGEFMSSVFDALSQQTVSKQEQGIADGPAAEPVVAKPAGEITPNLVEEAIAESADESDTILSPSNHSAPGVLADAAARSQRRAHLATVESCKENE